MSDSTLELGLCVNALLIPGADVKIETDLFVYKLFVYENVAEDICASCGCTIMTLRKSVKSKVLNLRLDWSQFYLQSKTMIVLKEGIKKPSKFEGRAIYTIEVIL